MALPQPRLYNPENDSQLLPQIVQIHADCITHDHQLATFLDLSPGPMLSYWTDIHTSVEHDRTALFLHFSNKSESELAGYVYLTMPISQTGPFRSEVGKLMVSTRHRRKGIARRLMGALERYARDRERYLIILDTTIGLPAEKVYPRFGYKVWGILPKYGISPADGSLVDEVFFYKDLRETKCLDEE